jgi:hypothetical protein
MWRVRKCRAQGKWDSLYLNPDAEKNLIGVRNLWILRDSEILRELREKRMLG